MNPSGSSHGAVPSARQRLAAAIAASDLPKYVYSYPSKYAYRPLEATHSIERIWSGISGPINLYVHIPFCGYRCSFCTLFLTTSHSADMRQRYVEALQRQIAMYGALLKDVEVVSLYFGGGTPTVLREDQFETLFSALHSAFPDWRPEAEIAVEGSPDTMTQPLLAALKALGVNRISMGLQTLDAEEQRRVGRRYDLTTVHRAVDAIQSLDFANVNYDLIYGLEGQTRQTWFTSLRTALGFAPRTTTLYPVVFRPMTSILKRKAQQADRFLENASKYALYDESVAYLEARGFRQNSFVRFSTCRDDGLKQEASDFSGIPLLGFGAGSRSYTEGVHYGTDFAVGRGKTMEIIGSFIERRHHPEQVPGLGFVLDVDERKRRFCALNLSLGRMDAAAYDKRWGGDVGRDFQQELEALKAEDCVEADDGGSYRLTRKGFKYSNVIGALFQSQRVSELEARFTPI